MTTLLLLFGVSLGAAAAAFVGNRALYRALGARAAVTLVPWWEEAAKLVASLQVPGVPMLFVHLVFGVLELTYDLWRGRKDTLFLGLLTFAGHGLCGSVAMLLADTLGGWGWAYLGAGLTHALFNAGVIYLVLPTFGAGAESRR